MLFGTADPAQLAAAAPQLRGFETDALTLHAVRVFQVLYEIGSEARLALLPPALHPVDPALAWWTLFECGESPFGPFRLAQLRIGCRSGVRPRGFLIQSFFDSPEAGRALASRWGYRNRPAEIRLARQYDAVCARVIADGRNIFEAEMRDPDPLGANDVQYTASMHLAHTPRGLRLVQVDPSFVVERAERGRPRVLQFDAAAWGDGRIAPSHPVSASIALADVTLPVLRYVCRPDVWAFDGTETV